MLLGGRGLCYFNVLSRLIEPPEKRSLQWYEGEASKAYMVLARQRLCSNICEDASASAFSWIHREVQDLESVLFSMSDTGGAPKAFLDARSTAISLGLVSAQAPHLQADEVEEVPKKVIALGEKNQAE